MENFDDAISSLQSEVNKYSTQKSNMLRIDDINLPDFQLKKEFKILSSNSGPKIDFNKFMIAFPFLLFIALYYFKPEFIMVDNPQDSKGKRVNYGKLVIVVFIVSLVVYCIGNTK